MSILRGIALQGTGSKSEKRSGYGSGVAIYALGDQQPTISSEAFVHPDATIIGSVTIGAQSSIWPGAVLRGDGGEIVIGDRTSVQDNAVIHTIPFWSTTVGNDCVLGHLIHLEGCTIEDRVLIGNSSMVLHRCVIRTGSIVAANAVVLNGMEVPTGAIAVGTPATIKEGRARPKEIELASQEYVRRAQQYRTELRRLD
jgi:carbonic anhydrase/acetyltransferase-like protein (isoleucine patch superfamily)